VEIPAFAGRQVGTHSPNKCSGYVSSAHRTKK
jgi:hypothetical protein